MQTTVEAHIQAYLRLRTVTARNRDTERIGPFLAAFSRSSNNPFLNYAMPDDNAQPTADQVLELIRAYEQRGLHPRLEYITNSAPSVEAMLLDAGFVPEGRLALMICQPGEERELPIPPGIELLHPKTEQELLDLRTVQHEAYGDPEPPNVRDVERLVGNIRADGTAVLARLQDTHGAVGAGEYTAPIDGLTEITSIAVREPFRRRGIAAAMTTWLVREALGANITLPFLMANEVEERIYARTGFQTVSQILHISR